MTTRILLADEHQASRQGLRTLLDKEPDFEVVAEAGTEAAALRLVLKERPDVVILDLAMAGLKGPEPVQQIVAAAPATKVIGLSMYGDRRFVVEVLKAGAFGYVLKDYAAEDLTEAVRAVRAHKTYLSQGLSDIIIQDYLEIMRDSGARFRTIFEGSNSGIALLNQEGRIMESNPALQDLLGYTLGELCGKEFSEFDPSEEATGGRDHFREYVLGNREPYQFEQQFRRKDGRLVWGRLSVSPLRGLGSEGQVAVCLLEDLSPQKQAESRIRDYQDKLRAVALELSLTEERERRRITTELQDQVGQVLALAQIKLGYLRKSVSTSLAGPLEEIRLLIDQTIRYIRSLSLEMSPAILYDLGFEAAVEWLADLLQDQFGIRPKVAADLSPKPLSDEIRLLLFQLVREILTKAVKGAKPNNVAVLINRNGKDMVVIIENDGLEMDLGIESPPTIADGLGFFGIKERLQYLGGSLKIESEPGRGSWITLVAPLKNEP
jgi:PAS domain S-box-containing protein